MRSSRILKHFTIYGVLLSFILIGCGEDTGQSASVEEDPIDVGLPMEDAYVCPPPCVEVDQGPIGDVGVPSPAIPEFPQGESAPASGYSMVSAPLTLFDVLADGRILGATQAGITVFDGDQTLDLGETFGQLIGAHTVAGDHLVFTTEGIFALMGNELQPSPLNEVVSNIVRVVRTGPSSMWLISAQNLHHWDNGTLRSLSLDDVEIDWLTAQIAAGHYDGARALWAAQGASLFALTTEGAWTFDWPEDIAWIAGTDQGVWIAHEHLISHRTLQGEWTQYQRPQDAIYGVASSEASDLWISSGTQLWQWTGDALRARDGAPAHGRLRLGDNGDIYLSNRTGVYRVSAGRLVLFDGLAEGGRLLGETDLGITASSPENVEEITVRIDASDPVILGDAPWSIALSATVLGPGVHDIQVDVRYTDGQAITGQLSFLGPPTWVNDIGPLSEAQCAACHGDGGSAHPMATAEQWQFEIAAIMDDIETGRMPYGQPRLSEDLIQLVRDWRDSGFLEQ